MKLKPQNESRSVGIWPDNSTLLQAWSDACTKLRRCTEKYHPWSFEVCLALRQEAKAHAEYKKAPKSPICELTGREWRRPGNRGAATRRHIAEYL